MNKPKKNFEIYFEIGGYMAECYKIFNIDNKLIIDKTFSYGRLIESRIEECDNKQWNDFWIKIDELNVWKWEKEYWDEVMDGTQWELMIDKIGRKRRKIHGSNKFPKNFEALTKLIGKISNTKDL